MGARWFCDRCNREVQYPNFKQLKLEDCKKFLGYEFNICIECFNDKDFADKLEKIKDDFCSLTK